MLTVTSQNLTGFGLPTVNRMQLAQHENVSLKTFKIPTWWYAISTVSMAASVYHGYKRNRSVGWALAWGAAGALFPIVTPAIALAQGFGKRKR